MAKKNFLRFSTAVFVCAASTLFSIGCTRSVDQTAHITISLPQTKSEARASATPAATPTASPAPTGSPGATASTYSLAHVVINVTGSGISSPVALLWDSNGGQNAAPASFPVTVPGGKGRLVQVLAVYSNGSDQFYYGDVTADITADTTLPVAVAALATGVGEGSVAGQYLTATGTGPTEAMNMMYTPAGKPAMLIQSMQMVGGFFSSFALSGVGFNYVLADGTDIFGGPLDVGAYTPTGAQVSFYLPTHYSQHGSSNSSSYQLRNQSAALFGYFGPGAAGTRSSSLKVCYPSAGKLNGAFSNLGVTPISYSPSAGPTATTVVHVANAGASVVNSTNLDSQGLCKDNVTGHVIYTNYLAVDVAQIMNENQSLAFQGAYQSLLQTGSNSRNALSLSVSGLAVTATATYLPGVTTTGAFQGVDGTDYFFRVIPSTYPNPYDFQNSNGGNTDCTTLGSMPTPFVLANHDAVTASSTLLQTIGFTLPAALGSSSQLQVVACPYQVLASGQVYLNAAASMNYGSGSGSSGSSSATQFQMADYLGNSSTPTTAATFNIGEGVCTPIVIGGLNGSNSAVLPPWGANYSITLDNANVTVYHSPACPVAGDLSSPNNIQFNNFNGYVIYLKSSAAMVAATTVHLTISDTVDGMTSFTQTLNFMPVPGTIGQAIFYDFPSSVTAYSCYPLNFTSAVDDATIGSAPWMPAGIPTGYAINFPTYSVPGLLFYYDAGCSTLYSGTGLAYTFVTGSGTVSSTQNQIYYSYTGTASSFNMVPDGPLFTPAGGLFLGANPTINVTQPGAPAKFNIGVQLLGMPTLTAGTSGANCATIQVTLADSNGNPTPAPAGGLSVSVYDSGTVGGLYASSGCYSGALNALPATPYIQTLAAGATSFNLYYQSQTASGTDTIKVVSGALTGSTNVTVAPPPPTMMLFVATSASNPVLASPQVFTSGSASYPMGNPGIAFGGQTVNYTVYAVTSGATYNLASTFNGGPYPINISGVASFSTASLNFVNGVAHFSITTNATTGSNLNINMGVSPAGLPYLSSPGVSISY